MLAALKSAIKRFALWNRAQSRDLAERMPNLFGYPSYWQALRDRIQLSLDHKPASVLEVGGIDRPLLAKGQGFEYTGLDIEERPGCHEVYDRFLVQSVEDPIEGRYEVIISGTLMEHVPDNSRAVRAMWAALPPGGETHHYIPSKWHPYSVALRLVGPKLQVRMIPVLRPGSEGETGYPAYFDHCTGQQMRKLFEDAGFVDVDVEHYFWATDYFAWFVPAYFLINIFGVSWQAIGPSSRVMSLLVL